MSYLFYPHYIHLPVTGQVSKVDKSEVLGTLVDSVTGGVVSVTVVCNCIHGTEI